MPTKTQYYGVRRSDGMIIGRRGNLFEDRIFLAETASAITSSCTRNLSHHWFSWLNWSNAVGSTPPPSPRIALQPGDIIDVFEVELTLDGQNNSQHTIKTSLKRSLIFDDKKKRPGMRWL